MDSEAPTRFSLGQVVATPGALKTVDNITMADSLLRHQHGDWGEALPHEDVALNDRAVEDGSRILSAYFTPEGVKFWIITEADRRVTTILLPEEY